MKSIVSWASPSVPNWHSKASRLLVVADQQVFPGQRGRVPRLFVEGGEPGQFVKPVWLRIHQDHCAALCHDEQQFADQERLSVTVPAILPRQSTRPGVD